MNKKSSLQMQEAFEVGADLNLKNSGLVEFFRFTIANRWPGLFVPHEIRKALPNRSAFLQPLNPADLNSIARKC